jgi:hypothetical protein
MQSYLIFALTAFNSSDSHYLQVIRQGDTHGMYVAIARVQNQRKVSHPMKIDISLLAGFLLVGTDLLSRVAVQGVEQALVTTAIKYVCAAGSFISKRARATVNTCFGDRAT